MTSSNGIVNVPSNHSVDETAERLQENLHAKGVTLFALVDHAAEAQKSRNENAADQTAHLREPQRPVRL